MTKKASGFVILFFFLLFLCPALLTCLRERSQVSGLTGTTNESGAFRRQQLGEQVLDALCAGKVRAEELPALLASTMLQGKFSPTRLSDQRELYEKYKEEEFSLLVESYAAIWQDLEVFPLSGETVSYADSWMARRDYGGERRHEGCDLLIEGAQPGEYPVFSMTDGVVEKVGWLPLGGYRLGIRSPPGGYFYYAHLSQYWTDYRPGDEIQAGEVIGFMGDSGYGEEGTAGKFPVHLHLGIYIRTGNREEVSVNPYWVLRFTEKTRRRVDLSASICYT